MAELDLPPLITRLVVAVLAKRPDPKWLANVLKERRALVREINRCLAQSTSQQPQQSNGGPSYPSADADNSPGS